MSDEAAEELYNRMADRVSDLSHDILDIVFMLARGKNAKLYTRRSRTVSAEIVNNGSGGAPTPIPPLSNQTVQKEVVPGKGPKPSSGTRVSSIKKPTVDKVNKKNSV